MEPPYLRRERLGSLDKGRAGKKHEPSLAKRVGGDLRPGSGALPGAKGDVTKAEYLIEGKTSTKDSYTVTKNTLAKISSEALQIGRTPLLSVCFVNSEGQSDKKYRWVMMTEAHFLELTGGKE